MPVFAQNCDRMFAGEKNDLPISALAQENRHRVGIPVGNIIQRGLHGAEIPGAVDGDNHALRTRSRRRGAGRETPGSWPVDPAERVITRHESSRAHRDIVAAPVSQSARFGHEPNLPINPENRIDLEMIDATDGALADRRPEREGFNDRPRGGIVDLDPTRRHQRWGSGENQAQRSVRRHLGRTRGREKTLRRKRSLRVSRQNRDEPNA